MRPSWASRSRAAVGRVLAIKAGKNNRTPVFVALDELARREGQGPHQVSQGECRPRAALGDCRQGRRGGELGRRSRGGARQIVDERGSPKKHESPRRHADPAADRRAAADRQPLHAAQPHRADRALCAGAGVRAARAGCDAGAGARPQGLRPGHGLGRLPGRGLPRDRASVWSRPGSAGQDKQPTIPADEDEELHARRLVAQRCLYGVDKNPRAVDLARLSLWLATLARDHEFTFLDHALKCGDSLVGLTQAQIAAAHWDTSKPGLPLFRQLVKERVAEAMKGRAEIQAAPDDTARAIQEARHRSWSPAEGHSPDGDAVIAAFFAADKPKARENEARRSREPADWILKAAWDKLAAMPRR